MAKKKHMDQNWKFLLNRLGELTMQLQGNQGSSGASAAKWTDEEV